MTANYVGPGADLWHPNPGFLYKKGGGPVLDMAPYFLTTLVSMLGPIEQLFCFANRGFDVRRIHGADVDDYALIGMGSTLLDGVHVGKGAIVAAGALVLKGTQIGEYEIWGGVPAKFIKKADPAQTEEINKTIAHNYAMYASWYDFPESK